MPQLKLIANWWAWELVPSEVVGDPVQIPGTAGRFHGYPVSGNQPCKRPPPGTITLKELQWRNLPDLIPTMNHFLLGIGRAGCRIGKLATKAAIHKAKLRKQTAKIVICKDQCSRQLQFWRLEPNASTWWSKPFWPPHRYRRSLGALARD